MIVKHAQKLKSRTTPNQREETSRAEELRKIADATLLSQGAWETYIQALRRVGYRIVPVDPSNPMISAAGVRPHALQAAIEAGAL